MRNGLRQSRRGFSMLEMAVVIIILGIVLTMTLKGQVLIEMAKSFWAGYEMQLYENNVQLYAVQYGYMPGDDPHAASRFGHPDPSRTEFGAVVTSAGDSKLDGKFMDFANPNNEQFMAWRDLRFAKLLHGDPALEGQAAMPANPFGGVYGFDEGNLGQKKLSLCLNKVPGGAAERIDTSLDDGKINDGLVVGTSRPDGDSAFGHFAAPDSQPYDVDKEYIICMALAP